MGVIFRDSHLDTRHKRCILLRAIVPKRGCADVGEGNAILMKELEPVQMAAANKNNGCSRTTNSSALRAELGVYPPSSET